MNILITAFEPFGNSGRNSSLDTLNELPDITPTGHRLIKLTLPVEYDRCGTLLSEAVHCLQPDAVVCLGQAEGRGAITPEYIAVNVKHSKATDNGGISYLCTPVEENAPDGIFTTLPVQPMTETLSNAKIPAALSFTAGTFVCNTLFYHALRLCQGMNIPAGFIHLPLSEEIAREEQKTVPALPQDQLTKGLLLALDCL